MKTREWKMTDYFKCRVRSAECGVGMRSFRLARSFRTGKRLALPLLMVGLLVSSLSGWAQSYNLSWFTIDGGGITFSSAGNFTLSGTIGQPDAGMLSGGNYELTGGFWGVAVAIQNVGAPLLKVTRAGSNVIITWPSSETGFLVEVTDRLASPTQWTGVSQTPALIGDQHSVTLPASVGNKFYRLRQQ